MVIIHCPGPQHAGPGETVSANMLTPGIWYCHPHSFPATPWLIIIAFALLIWSVSVKAADPDDVKYRQALELAHAGQNEAALPILRRLVEAHPDKRAYLYDYIAVLGWAEHDDEVLALQPRIDTTQAPAYVIETFGKSARNVRNFPLAVEYYRQAVTKAPDRLQSNLGLALALADNGEEEESETILRQLAERRPVQIDVLAGLAELYRIEKRPFDAFVLQDRILRINPNNREAQRQRILLAAELGAADQAVRLAERQPGLLTPEEMEKIRREQAIQIAGWGGLYNPDARYAETDAAIGLMQQQLGA